MPENNKKVDLAVALFMEEARKVADILNEAINCQELMDLGSRGALLTNAIGELNGFLARQDQTGTLLQRAVWVVNMFDQADTGGAIMRKNDGEKLRAAIEELRIALNQNGKLTILDAEQIESAIAARR
jgi:hypothetical protein